MSQENGVIKIGRKGLKKFAFGEDGQPFEVDVVVAFQEWIAIDESYRDEKREIPTSAMIAFHQAAIQFATTIAKKGGLTAISSPITTAEALDFIARLREQYDELADFFQPRPREKPSSPSSSEVRFSTSEI